MITPYLDNSINFCNIESAKEEIREFGIRNIKKVEVVVYSPYVQVMVPVYSRRNNMQQVPSIDSL